MSSNIAGVSNRAKIVGYMRRHTSLSARLRTSCLLETPRFFLVRSASLRARLRRKEKDHFVLLNPALTRQRVRKNAHTLPKRAGLLSAIPFAWIIHQRKPF
jgi:hypothetical protein